ncbi:MAG: hypothetical protein LBP41_01175 [Holosporaceae bacterium]|jgi:hypothetical protein|nr:hypothetical protein [Holosporaceae bacterium]
MKNMLKIVLLLFCGGIVKAEIGPSEFFPNGEFYFYGSREGNIVLPIQCSPLWGTLFISSGFLQNLRLDGNVRQNYDGQGGRRQYKNDKGQDDVMRLNITLFPSNAGELKIGGEYELSANVPDFTRLINLLLRCELYRRVQEAALSNDAGTLMKKVFGQKSSKKNKSGSASSQGDALLKSDANEDEPILSINIANVCRNNSEWRKLSEHVAAGGTEIIVKDIAAGLMTKSIDLLGPSYSKGIQNIDVLNAINDEKKYGYSKNTVEFIIWALVCKALPAGKLEAFMNEYIAARNKLFSPGYIAQSAAEYAQTEKTKIIAVAQEIAKLSRLSEWCSYDSPCQDSNIFLLAPEDIEKMNNLDGLNTVFDTIKSSKRETFPNCQENTVRHLITALLTKKGLDSIEGTISAIAERVAEANRKIGDDNNQLPSRLPNVKFVYQSFASAGNYNDQSLAYEWNTATSNLNNEHGIVRVKYNRSR